MRAAGVEEWFEQLEPDRMTDAGMWAWAVIVAVVSLAASYGIALGWQRWKARRKA